jgi:hypothetical protein
MRFDDIHFMRSGHPCIVARTDQDLELRAVYNSRTGKTSTVIVPLRTFGQPWNDYWRISARPLAESRISGPYPIDSLVRYEDEVYVVLGYFRRFMVIGHFDTGALCIVRKGHKSIHRHLLI